MNSWEHSKNRKVNPKNNAEPLTSKPMDILILGIDHTIQHIAPSGEREQYVDNDQRKRYELLLKQIRVEHRIQFIAEETHPKCGIAIGKQVADSLRPPIRWANIEMPIEEQKKRGIYDKLQNRKGCPRVGTKEVWFDTEDRVEGADDEREEYWIRRILEEAAGAQNILVICGEQHVGELGKKLKRDGHNVTTDCLRKYDWYWKNQQSRS
jgi:hypothetical protein